MSEKACALILKLLVSLGILIILGIIINHLWGYWGTLIYILIILMINYQTLREITK